MSDESVRYFTCDEFRLVLSKVEECTAEIDRLRTMLTDHGINPDGEYIAPGGLRVDAPASKIEPSF